MVAYETAYLKAYYPLQFMAVLLTFEMHDTDKVVEYFDEARKMGIDVRARTSMPQASISPLLTDSSGSDLQPSRASAKKPSKASSAPAKRAEPLNRSLTFAAVSTCGSSIAA